MSGNTLHMELPELPDAIMVRLSDKRDREVYSLRSWRYVREGESENDKLRELVKEMRVCLEDECKRCHEWGDACDLEHQMRDLGVEED